jgi:hypothetical protein
MKRFIFIFVFLLPFTGHIIWAEEFKYTDFNGYFLEKMAQNEITMNQQRSYVIGILKGYSWGHMMGHGDGMLKGLTVVHEKIKKSGVQIEPKLMKELRIPYLEEIFKLTPDPNIMFKNDYDYYFTELLSFYKQFPLCRSKNLDKMLLELIQVWAEKPKKTYKEIGEACLTQGK